MAIQANYTFICVKFKCFQLLSLLISYVCGSSPEMYLIISRYPELRFQSNLSHSGSRQRCQETAANKHQACQLIAQWHQLGWWCHRKFSPVTSSVSQPVFLDFCSNIITCQRPTLSQRHVNNFSSLGAVRGRFILASGKCFFEKQDVPLNNRLLRVAYVSKQAEKFPEERDQLWVSLSVVLNSAFGPMRAHRDHSGFPIWSPNSVIKWRTGSAH